MTVLNSGDLALLRTRPHLSKLWLSIYQPPIVLACRVNDSSIAKGAREITYGSVSQGSYALVENGMTLYIGKTPGGKEKGKLRVRSATPTVLTVAENSINWEDGDYLTIVRFFEIQAVYPRILRVGDYGNTVWYKDYDIAYSNQNDILGTFICMGSHYAGFLDNGQCQVYYTATGTANVLGEGLSYSWFFQGATVTGSSAFTPGYITYNTPGYYTTRLTVTSTSNATDVSYRHVSIYNRPGHGSNTPIEKWELIELNGSRDNGGYTAKVRIYENLDLIYDGALVVIFAEDWYGNTKKSLGGNAVNRSSIVFCGYILGDTIRFDYNNSIAEFEIGSPTEIMKRTEGFAISCKSSSSPISDPDPDIPSPWVLIKDMNIKRGLYHYLRWHSTTLLCNDLQFLGIDKNVQYMDTDRTSLYDAAYNWINGTLMGEFVCDRQGKMWAEVSVMATDNASGTFPVAMTLTRQDWMNQPEIVEAIYPELSGLELGGIAFSGASTGTSQAFLSHAPGITPSYYGSFEQIQGLVINSQNDLNTLAGNVLAYRNARYPSVVFDLSGNYRNLDIAPQELITVTIKNSDTPLSIAFTEKPFTIRGMSWTYSPSDEAFLLTSLDLHEVTKGYPADTVEIPPEPPDDTPPDRPPEPPNWPPPIPPTPPPPIPPPQPTYDDPQIAFVIGSEWLGSSGDLILARSTNFHTASPHWERLVRFAYDGVPDPISGAFVDFVPNPSNPAHDGFLIMGGGVWWIVGLDWEGTPPLVITVLTQLDINNLLGTSGEYYRLGQGVMDFSGNLYVRVSIAPIFSEKTWVFKRYPDGTWETRNYIFEIRDGGGLVGSGLLISKTNPNHLYATGTAGGGRNKFYRTTDNGITWTQTREFPSAMDWNHIRLFHHSDASWGDIPIYAIGLNSSAWRGYVLRGNNDYTSYDDITPYINGKYIGGRFTGHNHIAIHQSNPNKIAALLDDHTIFSMANFYLLTSDNRGTTWTLRATIPHYQGPGESSIPFMLIYHPYNENYLYLTASNFFSGGSITATHDKGATWINKTGDWVSQFGVKPTDAIGWVRGTSSNPAPGYMWLVF